MLPKVMVRESLTVILDKSNGRLEAEPFFFAGQQAFDAQLFDTGYHQHADQHTQRSQCFGNL